MIYLTSDLHFNHMNILKYEPESRPFSSIEEMNETIIQNWNEVVKISDTVYVLGDMSMGLVENAIPLIKRLSSSEVITIRPSDLRHTLSLGLKSMTFSTCHMGESSSLCATFPLLQKSLWIWLGMIIVKLSIYTDIFIIMRQKAMWMALITLALTPTT